VDMALFEYQLKVAPKYTYATDCKKKWEQGVKKKGQQFST